MFHSRRFVRVLVMLLVAVMLATVGSVFAQEHDVHWGYEGEDGPTHWGELSEDYTQCVDGSAQSPINISNAVELDLADIEFSYADSAMNIFNNGHTIQVNADNGSSIVYNEIVYNLLQVHFHNPSEHTIDGEPANMEAHFVHQDPLSGNLAVVGIMLLEGESDNANYATIFDNLPAEEGEPDAMGLSISLGDLLAEEQTYFTYQGSLTTPPCSQIVRWLLLDTPLELSATQIEAFATIHEGNARPVQPIGDRDLFVDTNS